MAVTSPAVAVETVRTELAIPGSIVEVVFACFGEEVLSAYAHEGVSVVMVERH